MNINFGKLWQYVLNTMASHSCCYITVGVMSWSINLTHLWAVIEENGSRDRPGEEMDAIDYIIVVIVLMWFNQIAQLKVIYFACRPFMQFQIFFKFFLLLTTVGYQITSWACEKWCTHLGNDLLLWDIFSYPGRVALEADHKTENLLCTHILCL